METSSKYNLPERFIKDLLTYCASEKNIKKIILYGSRARGNHRFNSDIDLAILATNITHREQNLMEYQIQEIPTPLKIDIVFINRLKKKGLLQNIKQEGMILYEQRHVAREA